MHRRAARDGRYADADGVSLFGVLVNWVAIGSLALFPEALGRVGALGRIEFIADSDWNFVADFLEAKDWEVADWGRQRRRRRTTHHGDRGEAAEDVEKRFKVQQRPLRRRPLQRREVHTEGFVLRLG